MILNAKITSADIIIEDHDILTFTIGIDTSGGWSTNIRDFYLDWIKDGERVPAPYTSKVIRAILETVDARSWSDLVGKYIRIDDNDRRHSTITKIAHPMKDNWIDLRALME